MAGPAGPVAREAAGHYALRMGHQKTPALVLKSSDFGESDRIIHFFTRNQGRLRGVAKGAKRSLKRFVGSLEPLSYVDLRFFEKKTSDLVRVEAAALRVQFAGIRTDLDKLAEAAVLAEIVSLATGEREAHRALFDTLLRALRLVDQLPAGQAGIAGVGRLLEIRVLSLLGFEPGLLACVQCRKGLETIGRPAFSVLRGGLLCEACSAGEQPLIPVGVATLRLLSQGVRADIEILPRFTWTPEAGAQAARVVHAFAQAQLGRELRALRFMHALDRDAARRGNLREKPPSGLPGGRLT